jgi:hypothetical protein
MSKEPITGRQPRSRLERRVVGAQAKAPDLVVIEPLNQWTCTGCGGSGSLLLMEDGGPLCMTCADLDHLVFLPAGDAALSRRARKASRLVAVVVRFSRSRKRYERQGILVEEAALQQAEVQCLADEDARARRRKRDRQRRADQDLVFEGQLAEAVARLFPGCPRERAAAIARFAAVRGSGRIGRSAAGRALDDRAITLAVAASVRHEDSGYDELLMAGAPRPVAREQVQPAIDRVLAAWGAPAETPRRGGACDDDAVRRGAGGHRRRRQAAPAGSGVHRVGGRRAQAHPDGAAHPRRRPGAGETARDRGRDRPEDRRPGVPDHAQRGAARDHPWSPSGPRQAVSSG